MSDQPESPPEWRLDGTTLRGGDNVQYEVLPYEFWYVVPSRASYSPEDGKVRALEFGFVLHNASIAKGLLIAPSKFTGGAPFRPRKGGAGGEAEDTLEDVRKEVFSNRPSRRNSYFLNVTHEIAETRSRDILRGEKAIVRCLVVANGAKVHFADMDLYERLEGRPDDRNLAARYWETFRPRDDSEQARLEVVAESALYFPDWQSFPQIPTEDLVAWTRIHR